MLVSRKYIAQYFDLNQYSNTKIAQILTDAGFEVEKVNEFDFDGKLVVGEVLRCEKHPDSDHLHVCEVDVKDETLQIVCGANNVKQGIKVIVAKIGCQLPELKIVKSKVRGIESSGMLCSLLELGVNEQLLSDQQKNGIEILSDDAIVGENVLSYVGLDDAIFELGLTPNRSDVVSIHNLLKELSAIFNQPVNIEIPTYIDNGVDTPIKAVCDLSRYISAQRVEGVEIKESSKKIQDLLSIYGIKSINNIVDISNYVMLLTGQPNHMYDASYVKGSLRIVDDYEGEFLALDGNTYMIEKGDLMIFDDEKALGIAGIMGGEHSKVCESTKDVLIEVANFERMKIRNTARRLNITSESSIKYQKNIDPKASEYATRFIVSLLQQEANAKTVFKKVESNPKQIKNVVLQFDTNRLNQHLGSSFSNEEIFDCFRRLDFKVENNRVSIPTYRSDITVVEDLYEEVIRLLGYHHLPTTLPKVEASNKTLPLIQKHQRSISQFLTHHGYFQTVTYTLISDVLDKMALNPTGCTIALAQPLSDDRKYIRRSVIASMLEVVAYNKARSIEDIALYEISDVTSEMNSENRLGIVLSGNAVANHWKKQVIKSDFYVMKALVYRILQQLGFDQTRVFIKPNESHTILHPYQTVDVYIGRDFVGTIGKVHPNVLKQMNIPETYVAELNLTLLSSLKVSKIKYKPISKYQMITRDIALLIDEKISFEEIKVVIEKAGKPLVKQLTVFDIYQGEHIEVGKKSMAIRMRIQSENETLDTKQIQELTDKIAGALDKAFSAQIR